jgi:hypothetical protein
MATEAAISGFILGYIVIRTMFDDIAGLIIEKIDNADDVARPFHGLKETWSTRKVSAFVLALCVLWVFLGVGSWSIALDGFVGYSFTFTTILVAILAGLGFSVPFWLSQLAFNLKNHQYDVNSFCPNVFHSC